MVAAFGGVLHPHFMRRPRPPQRDFVKGAKKFRVKKMASMDASSESSEQIAVVDKVSIPANLQPFFGTNKVLWRSFEALRNSTQSLGKALSDTTTAMKQVKKMIRSLLKTVHDSGGITDAFRHNLLLFVLSDVNQIPISSFDGGHRSTQKLSKIPNHVKYYNMIRDESITLKGGKLLTQKGSKVDKASLDEASLETIEFMAVDEEG